MLRLTFRVVCALALLVGCGSSEGGGDEVDASADDVDSAVVNVDAMSCPDVDMDGVTTCDGDCDDLDVNTYPGAPEVCGDGVTNDCSNDPPDQMCGGLGTFVAPPPLGSDSNAGTQALPLETIGAGINNAVSIGGGVDVYVAAGTYLEDLTAVEGVSLLGGHDSADWTRNPAVNISIIDAPMMGPAANRITVPSGVTAATVIDGFTIRGRSSGTTSRAVDIRVDASPVVSNNVLTAGDTSGTSHAVAINRPGAPNTGTPRIDGNIIQLGQSGTGWGAGNGAWGISANATNVEIVGNRITMANFLSIQRGIELRDAPDTAIVTDNRVRGGGGADVAFGIRMASGGGLIDTNDIDPGACQNLCLGIAVEGNITTAVVTNNISYGGSGGDGTGFALQFEVAPMTTPDVTIHSNFFEGGQGGRFSAGALVGEFPSTPVVAGKFYNNILRSGTGASRYAFIEFHVNIDPEVFHNNALFLDPSGTPTQEALYRDEAQTDIRMIATINALPVAMANLDDDCSVVSPVVGGDFHLDPASNCIGVGSATDVPAVDYEDDTRSTTTPDIGVDEVVP